MCSRVFQYKVEKNVACTSAPAESARLSHEIDEARRPLNRLTDAVRAYRGTFYNDKVLDYVIRSIHVMESMLICVLACIIFKFNPPTVLVPHRKIVYFSTAQHAVL